MNRRFLWCCGWEDSLKSNNIKGGVLADNLDIIIQLKGDKMEKLPKTLINQQNQTFTAQF